MAIFDIYSKRKNRHLDDVTYTYDFLPRELRTQILFIMNRVSASNVFFSNEVVNILREEYGCMFIAFGSNIQQFSYICSQLETFINLEDDVDKVLDAVELYFRFVESVKDDWSSYPVDDAHGFINEAISDLNYRFKEHEIGYQYDSGIIFSPNSTAKCDTRQYQAANTISLKTIAGCLKSKHFFGR